MQYNADTSKKFHNRMTSIKEDDNPRETETKEFTLYTREKVKRKGGGGGGITSHLN